MYSFSVGTLASKGYYVLNFKSGYTLAKDDILSNLFRIAIEKKVNILEFNLLINKDVKINENSFNLIKCIHSNSSINTNEIKYNKDYKEIDQENELLINKLILNEKYKDIIIKYQLNKYNQIIYNNYDDIIIFLFNKMKYNFMSSNIFGVIKNINNINSLKLSQLSNDKKQKISDSIFYIDFIYNHSSNVYKDKKYVYNEYISRLSLIYNKLVPKTNLSIKLFKKFMNCSYINEKEKQELFFFYKSLNN